MRKRVQKVLASLLTTAMVGSMLAGCGSSKNTSGNGSTAEGKTYNGVDISEHVDLKMYLLGERSADFDKVYTEVNKVLEDKLNCTLSVDFLSWGEMDTKYSLLFSSQEDFDMIFTASGWGHYEQTVSLGGFYALDEEFVKTNAPELWDTVPEVAWSQAKVNGTSYMVPNNQDEFGQDVIAVRGDLLKKYGFEDISSWDDLSKFYMACAKDNMYASQGGPWYQYFQNKGMTMISGTSKELFLYNTQDPSDLSVTYLLDWDGFADYCKQAKEMADAGCWSSDVLSNTDERQVGLLSGKAAAMIWNTGSCTGYAKEANKNHPEWEVTVCDPVSAQPKKVNAYTNNGVGINATTKNPERAMMAINELYTNKTLQELTRYGIEGEHWEAVGDDQYKIINEDNYGVDSNCNWGWINQDLARTEYIENRTALDDVHDALKKKFEDNIKEAHVYDGFTFDPSNITTQVAAVEAALGNYYDPLTNGLVKDVDQSISELKAALEQAGIKDVQAEIERQAKEFVESKK